VLGTTVVITKYRSKEILQQRNQITFLLGLLLLLTFFTITKMLCYAHHIPRHLSNGTMLATHYRLLLYVESGPSYYKYLWGTSMWLKPNPCFSKLTTENQIA